MAFDVNQYRNARALSPTEKITTQVTSGISRGSMDRYIPVAQYASDSMIGNGLGISNITGLSARRADGVSAMSSSYMRDVYGDNTMRATPEAITKARLNSTESLDFYTKEVNPQSKIMLKKMANVDKTLTAL